MNTNNAMNTSEDDDQFIYVEDIEKKFTLYCCNPSAGKDQNSKSTDSWLDVEEIMTKADRIHQQIHDWQEGGDHNLHPEQNNMLQICKDITNELFSTLDVVMQKGMCENCELVRRINYMLVDFQSIEAWTKHMSVADATYYQFVELLLITEGRVKQICEQMDIKPSSNSRELSKNLQKLKELECGLFECEISTKFLEKNMKAMYSSWADEKFASACKLLTSVRFLIMGQTRRLSQLLSVVNDWLTNWLLFEDDMLVAGRRLAICDDMMHELDNTMIFDGFDHVSGKICEDIHKRIERNTCKLQRETELMQKTLELFSRSVCKAKLKEMEDRLQALEEKSRAAMEWSNKQQSEIRKIYCVTTVSKQSRNSSFHWLGVLVCVLIALFFLIAGTSIAQRNATIQIEPCNLVQDSYSIMSSRHPHWLKWGAVNE